MEEINMHTIKRSHLIFPLPSPSTPSLEKDITSFQKDKTYMWHLRLNFTGPKLVIWEKYAPLARSYMFLVE